MDTITKLYTLRLTGSYGGLKTYGIVYRERNLKGKWGYYCDAYRCIPMSEAVALQNKLKSIKGIKPLIIHAINA